ncbi:MAG: asparagine synthase (glutamine-hydrolyzing) [Pseudomonadales bacterium]|nr:asparagine synthase (glutamine-hydrolyzing) [Pseudomonadales bacterium]
MCGIFGTSKPVSDSLCNTVSRLLQHRGPDSEGIERVNNSNAATTMTLLHTRLSIQDLSKSGHQPMNSHNRRWWITYNGELYNHHELRQQLSIEFRGSSDTETLIEYVAAFGVEKALNDINGMYALAIFDTESQTLYLARDPFGIKPLYFHFDSQGLIFSSELQPILACLNQTPELDFNSLNAFLNLRYVPSPTTLLKNINRLQPGHFLKLRLDTQTPEIKTFIKPTFERFKGSINDAIENYQELLSAAVERQLIADVPVGVLLSAGIDSSIIAAMAKDHCSNLTAHTVGFGDQHAECEISDAAETAKKLGLQHDVVTVDPTTLIESLEDIVQSIEEPLGTTSIMPMWLLTKLARQSATVVLAGQGNDEPWGGYRRYQIEMLLQRAPILKKPLFRMSQYLTGPFRNDAVRRGLRCLGYAENSTRFAKAYALFSDDELKLLGLAPSVSAVQSIEYWQNLVANNDNLTAAECMMRIDTRMNLADDLLLYGDKISMHCALELRVPMLDHALVQFVESLPLDYKATMQRTKIVHREMAKHYLPKAVIERPKKGFQVPFGLWCKTIWRDYMYNHLLDPGLTINQILNHQGIMTLWRRHEKGTLDYSRQLFSLLTLSLWMENFISGSRY